MSDAPPTKETVFRYADQVTEEDLHLPQPSEPARFGSDLELQLNPKLGNLIQPVSHERRAHTTPRHPHYYNGYIAIQGLTYSGLIKAQRPSINQTLFTPNEPRYDGGLRIIRGNRHFRLIQEHGPEGGKRVEMSKALELAYFKSLQKRKDTANLTATKTGTTLKERVELGNAIEILASFYRNNQKTLDQSYEDSTYGKLTNPHASEVTGLGSMIRLGATLGKQIDAVLESAAKVARENEGVLNLSEMDTHVGDVSSLLEGAINAVMRKRFRTADGRSNGEKGKVRPKPHHVIEAASSLYFQHGDLPTKQSVAGFLLSTQQFSVTGQRPSKEWKSIFEAANLDDLREQGTWSALYPKSP